MDPAEFKRRTKQFALRVIRLVKALPADPAADVIGRQLLRSGTSVGANYRAATRARSGKDFVNKLKIVEEETDESLYWMELLIEAGLVKDSNLKLLMSEAEEILAMTVASVNTARKRQGAKRV
jgi:four helix bundle protein